MVNRLVVCLALSLPLVLASCKGLDSGAREEFAKKYSCPESRVAVKAREDLKYGDLILGTSTTKTPPDEVKRDPERLAKWEADQRKENQESRENLNRLSVYEVTGCDHRAFLGCAHPSTGDGVQLGEVNCWEIPAERVPK